MDIINSQDETNRKSFFLIYDNQMDELYTKEVFENRKEALEELKDCIDANEDLTLVEITKAKAIYTQGPY